jgi:hypothetical protein
MGCQWLVDVPVRKGLIIGRSNHMDLRDRELASRLLNNRYINSSRRHRLLHEVSTQDSLLVEACRI